MNTLYYYPIILPMPSGGSSGDIPTEVVWATLIVFNSIGLVSLLIAWLVNIYKNSKRTKYSKESFVDTITDYFPLYLGIALSIFIDIIATFLGLIYWVSTLL